MKFAILNFEECGTFQVSPWAADSPLIDFRQVGTVGQDLGRETLELPLDARLQSLGTLSTSKQTQNSVQGH